ncbi:DNA repair protein [Deinococcus sp. HMF7604]|uniref:DNA repair protein n=1 Tax=Deinococcus betulae TaxID=2873312 RepID=UPI001CCFC1AE|nr:DNA repair protein [Deinococcus betulae]MBZ9750210.1 DNA repair protein [Deinococcus betulae]
MARVKTKDERQTTSPFDAFDGLMATAALDPQTRTLAEGGADTGAVNAALSETLNSALRRWGLGLHHLRHEAQVTDSGQDIAILTGGRQTALVSEGPAALARALEAMGAADERGLSLWGVLGEGHRVPGDTPFARLRVLIEDARDFETEWTPARGGAFHRTWRAGDTLFVEVARPASPQTALSDAAWDVITSIKDRTFQRELMRRSEEMGMLGALLGARHASARNNLAALPDAHFTVQATIQTLSGPQARQAEEYRTALRLATEELDALQGQATRQLAEVLRHGLKDS